MGNWLANGQTQTCQWVDNCQNAGGCGDGYEYCASGAGASSGYCQWDWSVSGMFGGNYKSATASLQAYDETRHVVLASPKCSVYGPYSAKTDSCSAAADGNPVFWSDTILYTCSMEANSLTGANNELMAGQVSCSDSMEEVTY
jgi:hypothetical protein